MGPPRNQKDVRSFLELIGYYWNYVPNYGEVAVSLVCLTNAHTE